MKHDQSGQTSQSMKGQVIPQLNTKLSKRGIPERDIWFLGTLDQGSAQNPEFLGNRRRRRRRLLETQVDIQARKL